MKEKPSCGTCRYWDADGHLCRRYPQSVRAYKIDWCGEYVEMPGHRDKKVSSRGTVPIDTLEVFSSSQGCHTRVINALKSMGIEVIEDLPEFTEIDLARVYGIGEGARKEIEKALASHGLALKKSSNPWIFEAS